MKKTIITIILILLAGWVLLFLFNLIGSSDNSSNTAQTDYFSIYKKDCVLYTHDESGPVYRNNSIGLSLRFPEDSILCEKATESDSGRKEIMIWDETDFTDNIPTLPLAIIYVNDQLTDTLPQPIVVATEQKIVAGKTITIERVTSSECKKNNCLEYQTATFERNGHSFKVGILSDRVSWDDLGFE